jgi:hypothetical protein
VVTTGGRALPVRWFLSVVIRHGDNPLPGRAGGGPG